MFPRRFAQQLAAMGFPLERCRLALEQVGNDMQRAADWLLEDATLAPVAATAGASEPGPRRGGRGDGGSDGGGASSAADEGGSPTGGEGRWRRDALRVGGRVEASDEGGTWYEATVIEVDEFSARVHFLGWSRHWDAWLDRTSPRLRAASAGGAARGPGQSRPAPRASGSAVSTRAT